MPSVGLIRKRLLTLLDDIILPDIQLNGVENLLSANWPLNDVKNIAVREIELPAPTEKRAPVAFPLGQRWEEAGVHVVRFPVLKCVTAGELDLRIAATNPMLKQSGPSDELAALHVCSLQAPSYLLIPPHVPHSSGSLPHWERDEPHQTFSSSFSLRILPTGTLCHITTIEKGVVKPEYSLLVEDAFLAPSIELVFDELRSADRQAEIVCHQLLAFLLRVRKGLQNPAIAMTDGLYSRFPALPAQSRAPQDEFGDAVQDSVMEKAAQFIQLRLNESLSPAIIGRHVRLKPAQLNRIFRRDCGLSVMQYVARERVQTAQLILQTSELSIQEIGQLVGFKHASHFSKTFQNQTGASPSQFRQQHAHQQFGAANPPS